MLRDRPINVRRALFQRHIRSRVDIDFEPVVVSHCSRPKKGPAAWGGACRANHLHSESQRRIAALSCGGFLSPQIGTKNVPRDVCYLRNLHCSFGRNNAFFPLAHSLMGNAAFACELHKPDLFDCLSYAVHAG